MENNDYWIDFWKNNNIVNKETAHEKVGRTIKGVPIEAGHWQEVLDDLFLRLKLSASDHVLDIGAGSGVISIPFARQVKHVTALDISDTLLSGMNGIANITTLEGDARKINFEDNSFDKVIIYFALQHFTEEETVVMFKKIYQWLKPGGILLAGDIPDSARIFKFFNTPERQAAYFKSLETNRPIIGTWFQKDFFEPLGKFIGFKKTEIIDQQQNFINAHYRFDVCFTK